MNYFLAPLHDSSHQKTWDTFLVMAEAEALVKADPDETAREHLLLAQRRKSGLPVQTTPCSVIDVVLT